MIPGSGRSPGEGNGNPLQYSRLENPTDRGVWWATVRGVAKSYTQLSDETPSGLSCGVWVFSLVAVLGFRCPTTCRILVCQPGIEPESAAVEGRFLDHQGGPPRNLSKYRFPGPQTQRFSKVWLEISEFAPFINVIMILTQVDCGDPQFEKHCHGWISMKGFGRQDQWEKVCTLSLFASRPPCEEERSDRKSILSVGGESPAKPSKSPTAHWCLSPVTAIRSFTVTAVVLTVPDS